MASAQKPTAHEMVSLHELIRMQVIELQKVRSVLPMIGDDELRAELEGCEQTGQAQIRQLVDYCKQSGVAH